MVPARRPLKPIRDSDVGVAVNEEMCCVRIGQDQFDTQCRVAFRVDEFPSAEIELPALNIDFHEEPSASIAFLESGLCVEGKLSEIPRNKRPREYPYRYRVRDCDPIVVSTGERFVALDAFLYNFRPFSFEGYPPRHRERLVLDAEGWHFEVGPIPNEHGDVLKAMARTVWYVPTHYMTAEKKGGGGASAEEWKSALFNLRQFLSFAHGRWVGIALAQGYRADGQVAFAHWGRTETDAQSKLAARPPHWCHPRHAEALAEIFPGYWSRCEDRNWKDTVEWAVYWWLSANHPSQRAETSVLASQAGLEEIAAATKREARVTSSNGGGRRSKKQRKKRRKKKDLERLLGKLGIPLSLPLQLRDIQSLAKSMDWQNGPEALTEVRDALAHPSELGREDPAFEASQLGMWYLELALLNLFGFRGEYFNRTEFEGLACELDRVPWAAATELSSDA